MAGEAVFFHDFLAEREIVQTTLVCLSFFFFCGRLLLRSLLEIFVMFFSQRQTLETSLALLRSVCFWATEKPLEGHFGVFSLIFFFFHGFLLTETVETTLATLLCGLLKFFFWWGGGILDWRDGPWRVYLGVLKDLLKMLGLTWPY